MGQNFATLTFTDSVLEAQERYGSRRNWNGEENEPDRILLTDRETEFIGGLDDRQLAFADFRGNRQYISTGNLNSGSKAMLFLWDQARRMRLKIWVTGEVLNPEKNPELALQLIDPEYRGKVERLIVFQVQAYDWNCPQHITPRYTAEEFESLGIAEAICQTPAAVPAS